MQKKRVAKATTKKDAAVDKASKKDILTVQTSAKGGVFVDHKVPNAPTYTVISVDNKALSCYLMWSDIKDNHNKYYIA